MNPSTPNSERPTVRHWHAWVCLCLALSLFYNPFMAAPSSTSGLHVRHPASNRATVGAPELQQFSPADERGKLATRVTSAVVPMAFFPEVSSQVYERFPQVASPPQQFFGSSLWFRPPPAH